MRILFALIFTWLLTSCVNAPSVRESTSPSMKQIAGCYAESRPNREATFLILLRPNGKYVAFVKHSSIWAKATGKWSISDDGVVFGPSDQARGWHLYLHDIRVLPDGDHFKLQDLGSLYQLEPDSCGF